MSKQVRREALDAALTGTEKVFDRLPDLDFCVNVIGDQLSPRAECSLTNIKLRFPTIGDLIEFFGSYLPRMVSESESCWAWGLVFGPALKQLTIVFPNVSYEDRYFWENQDRPPCRRITADWVLTFAFQFLKHIPVVRLEGDIKTITKGKWEHLLDVDRREQGRHEKSHECDHDEALARILSQIPDSPICECALSCGCKRVDKDGVADFDRDDVYQEGEPFEEMKSE